MCFVSCLVCHIYISIDKFKSSFKRISQITLGTKTMAEIYSVLITGANRGIGLEFVKQFLTNSSVNVQTIIATCRNPERATELQEVKISSSKVHILKLDVNQFDFYDAFVTDVGSIVGAKGLTLLINNAGVGPSFLETLQDMTAEKYYSLYTTNSIAPVLLTKALYPLLKQSAEVNSTKTKGLSVTRAAVINMGSSAGSVLRTPEVWSHFKINMYCYSESKAALNMSTQSMAIELEKDGILVECFHPGVVDTEILKVPGSPQPEISTTTSVAGMISVMLTLTQKNKEGFYDYKGDVLPF